MKSTRIFLILRNVSIMLLDFFAITGALLLGYWLWVAFPWHGNYQPFNDYAWLIVILGPVGLWIFHSVGLYKPEAGILGVEEQSLLFKAIWILYTIGFAISFFYRDIAFSRLATFYSVGLSILLLSLERYLLRKFFEWLNQKGFGVRQALIYGAGHHGQRLERWIRQSPKLGIRVVGYLDDHLERLVKKPEASRVLGNFEDLESMAALHHVKTLFIAHRKLDEADVLGIFQKCRELGIQCWVIPSLYQFHVEHAQLFNIGGIPLVGFRHTVGTGLYRFVKRILDFVMGSLLLVFLSPLMVAIYFVKRVTSRQPVFFSQVRVGRNGKKFKMLKFRTLRTSAKQQAISPELQKNENLYLPFGQFLRRSGFDELPQLIHVVMGQMSIVGPRPEMPFIVEKYGPLERERLTVKPGITGLWQISEDRKRLLIHENMDYDLYYIERFSFNLDLAILAKTGVTILRRLFDRS